MEEREQGSSNIPELESPEAASAALNAAKSSTQEALKGNLQPEQRSFYEGVVENLEGAEAWLKERMSRRKFVSSAIGLTLAVSMLVSYAPNATGPVMASPKEGDNRATATEASLQFSPTTAPTEMKKITAPSTKETAPTAILLEINTNMVGSYEEILRRVENMTPIREEDIDSGLYAQKEQELLKSGEITRFPDGTFPFTLDPLVLMDFPEHGLKMMSLFDDSFFDNYASKKETLAYRICDMAITEINGQKILVIGVKYLNADRSMGFLHFGVQSYSSGKNAEVIKSILETGNGFWAASTISNVEQNWITDFDYRLEPVMVKRYQKNSDAREKMFYEWTEEDIIPETLQKQLLIWVPWKK